MVIHVNPDGSTGVVHCCGPRNYHNLPCIRYVHKFSFLASSIYLSSSCSCIYSLPNNCIVLHNYCKIAVINTTVVIIKIPQLGQHLIVCEVALPSTVSFNLHIENAQLLLFGEVAISMEVYDTKSNRTDLSYSISRYVVMHR